MARGDLRLVCTVAEAAGLLGIGRSTAYELVARGEIVTTPDRLESRGSPLMTRGSVDRLGAESSVVVQREGLNASLVVFSCGSYSISVRSVLSRSLSPYTTSLSPLRSSTSMGGSPR